MEVLKGVFRGSQNLLENARNQTNGCKKSCRLCQLRNKNISAVIIAYNDYPAVYRCIKSLKGQVSTICIVDNSTIKDQFAYNTDEVIYIKNENNIGLDKALNIGVKEVLKRQIDWVLLLDQDSVVDKNMLNNMLNSFDNADDQSIAQIVPLVYDINRDKYLPSLIYNKFSLEKIDRPQQDTFVDFQITSGSLIRKEIFEKIGFMDETFFIDYIDFDYCFRIRSSKHKILLSKDALLTHSLGKKSNKMGIDFIEHASIRIFYQVKNRLILMKRYGHIFPFFVISETRNLIFKFFKIIILENDKKEKLQNYFRGLLKGLK